MLPLGDIAGVVGIALAGGIAWRLGSSGGGSAVTELSKANEVLEKRLDAQGKEIRDLKAKNAELEQRTDFSATMAVHEQRASERHRATLNVLELIATRMGPDPNGQPPRKP